MALQTMISRLNKAKKAYETEVSKLGKKAGKEIAKELAEFIPEGFILQWDQYTDYFNDGEPCTFSVHDPHFATFEMPRELVEGSEPSSAEPMWANNTCLVIDDECEERPFCDVQEGEPGVLLLQYFDAEWNKEDLECPFFRGVTKAQLKKLRSAWKKLPEDLLEKVFGDHVTVRIYADGTFETEDCEHD